MSHRPFFLVVRGGAAALPEAGAGCWHAAVRRGGGCGAAGGGGRGRGEAGTGGAVPARRGGGRRLAACATPCGLHWLGVCLQCSHVDSLCESPATVLLLGLCLCDHNSLQLHLFSHPGQASLWGDVDATVVGWPHCDTLWPRAAAHCCTPANAAHGGEEGVVTSLLFPFPAWIMLQLLLPPGPNQVLTPCTFSVSSFCARAY